MARLATLVYTLVLLTTVGQVAIVPLLPQYGERFDVGAFETGWLLASVSVATLAVGIPAGALADRIGARRLTLAAGWLLVATCVGQALAPSFATLLACRFGFGIGYGCIWTTGLAWLAATRPADAGTRPLAAATTSSGLGLIAGPAFGGLVGEHLGLAAPFAILAGVCAAATALLAVAPVPAPAQERAGAPLRDDMRIARRRPGVRGGALAVALIGLSTSTLNLLIPLELHADGISADLIGSAFAVAAGIYIVVSAATVTFGPALMRIRAVIVGCAATAVALTPAMISASAAAVLVALALYTLPRAALSTLSYPIATGDGRRAGAGGGAVIGLLNTIWAATSVVGPLVTGAVFETTGARWCYALVAASGLAGVAVLWRDRHA
jgi:predicted MFS family arabinose efflux permease